MGGGVLSPHVLRAGPGCSGITDIPWSYFPEITFLGGFSLGEPKHQCSFKMLFFRARLLNVCKCKDVDSSFCVYEMSQLKSYLEFWMSYLF